MKVEVGKGYEAKGNGFAEKGDYAFVDMILDGIVCFWLEHPPCRYNLNVEEFERHFTESMEVQLGRSYKALKSGGDIIKGDIVRITKPVDKHKYLWVTKKGTDVELGTPLWVFKRFFIELENSK